MMGSVGHSTGAIAIVSAEKERKQSIGMSDISVDPEANSTRERCIRVAVIDIVASEGKWSGCVRNRHKQPIAPCSLQGTYKVNVR